MYLFVWCITSRKSIRGFKRRGVKLSKLTKGSLLIRKGDILPDGVRKSKNKVGASGWSGRSKVTKGIPGYGW